MHARLFIHGGLFLILSSLTSAHTIASLHASATPVADASHPAPVAAPTPPPDARAIYGDGYVRPGCPTFSCAPCTGDFDYGLAATGSTDCHGCACFPRTTSTIPASCSLIFCRPCGYGTTVTLTTPTTSPDDCPQCGCVAPAVTGLAASQDRQCELDGVHAIVRRLTDSSQE